MQIDSNSVENDLNEVVFALKEENEALKGRINDLIEQIEEIAKVDAEKVEYQNSQVRFRTIFERSRLGNKIISSDLVILQANSAMVALLGFESKEEIIGKKILEYAPLECQEDWRVLQKQLWDRSKPSFTLETCLQQKGGTVIHCRVTSILFQDRANTLGYTIIEDITEQVQLRKQKDDFINIATHELRTPITTLKASMQLIDRRLADETVSPTVTQLFSKSNKSLNKLNDLVEGLLNVTKLGKAPLSLNINEIEILQVLEGCCEHLRHEVNHEIQFEGQLDLKISADPLRLEQVLVNLLNNAIKYAPLSKDVIVRVEKEVEVAKILVIDNGPGIREEHQESLFERYYQMDKSPEAGAGLGLGLFISSEIIKGHGGEIGVESEPGNGSTFWFTIPLART